MTHQSLNMDAIASTSQSQGQPRQNSPIKQSAIKRSKLRLTNSAEAVDTIALVFLVLGVLMGAATVLGSFAMMSLSVWVGLSTALGGVLGIALSALVYGLIRAFMTSVRAQIDVRNALVADS